MGPGVFTDMAEWLTYDNQGAIRNQPLSAGLVDALSFLPQMGIGVRVFSGGQDAAGDQRTGSHRHDHGGAGDVFFYDMATGRQLDWSNPQDVPIFQDIVTQARSRGVTGFGAGEGYMQPGSMHIGFGTPAVWGAGGSGANAAPWLVEAFNGATGPAGGPVPTTQPPNALAAPTGGPLAPGHNMPPMNALAQQRPAPPQWQNALNVADFLRPTNALTTYGFQPGMSPYLQG
jgi:hypothetical protein